MAIIRKYKTKEECVKLMVQDIFSNIEDNLVLDSPNWYDRWTFYGEHYDDEAEDYVVGEYYVPPMWGTWFIIDDFRTWKFIDNHIDEVVECGFTLIYLDEELYALGIDGCGYDFYSAHWIPLYDLLGFQWHDEEE